MTETMKVGSVAMDLRSQLRKVIKIHSPGKMTIGYIQVVGILSLKPSTVVFLPGSKGKRGLEEMIWKNLKMLKNAWKP